MDSFLNFLTDNYTYFLIAAGVLLLALIGLIVSGRNKKKKEENVNFEETPVDNTITVSEPTAVSESQAEAPILSATPEPTSAPVQEQAPAPETITLETPTEAPKPAEPVQNTSSMDFNNNVSVPPAGPTQAPDEPIVQINPVENNTFNANQNNTNSNNTL